MKLFDWVFGLGVIPEMTYGIRITHLNTSTRQRYKDSGYSVIPGMTPYTGVYGAPAELCDTSGFTDFVFVCMGNFAVTIKYRQFAPRYA